MALFSWFSRKASSPSGVHAVAHRGPLDTPEPAAPNARVSAKAQVPVTGGNSANRKTERLERRELLYSVVRECMTRAGVLSASYKFKVLSLDPRGRQYLIMMDLVNRSAGEAGRLAEIETVIAQGAKTRHDIVVTAVYWRINERAVSSPSRQHMAQVAPAPPAPPLPRRAGAAALAGSGQVVQASAAEFEDTEVTPKEERVSPLSGTQYGDLV